MKQKLALLEKKINKYIDTSEGFLKKATLDSSALNHVSAHV